MAAISVTILPDASLETDAKVSSHLKMTVPASWIQKKRPMRKLLDAALKQWQLTDRSYALRRIDAGRSRARDQMGSSGVSAVAFR